MVAAGLAVAGCDTLQVASPNIVIGPGVSAGYSHTCAVAADGAVFCWGSNRYGELGIGSSDTLAHRTPARVPGLPLIAMVSAGEFRTCALTTSGTAWCWGLGAGGALGNGDVLSRESPSLVSGELAFKHISVGSHTCGMTAAGTAYCWGNGAYGQLGASDNASRLVPTLVAGGLSFTSISAGESHSCGTAGGVAYCWGMNAHGALGSGTPATTVLVPTAVFSSLSFASVRAGYRYSCAATAAGPTYCWGLNLWGELGAATPNSCLGFSDDFFPCSVTPLAVEGAPNMAAVAVGTTHTCGVTSGGEIHCWGANTSGQLGNGAASQQSQPAGKVSGTLTYALVTVGGNHTCGLTTSSAVYCWGSNVSGQLGDNSTQDRAAPSRVTFPR